MSHTTAAATVLWAAFLGETTTIISVGEREAAEVVQMAFKHTQVLQDMGSRWARCRLRGNELLFENGSGRVLALPSSSAGRGFSGNVFLDEFAYQEKPDAVWDGAIAVALHGYRVRVSSTPNGVGNAFHALWTQDKQNKGWSKHFVDIRTAIKAGLRINVADCWKQAKGDPRLFGQLFEGSFLDGNEQYIPTKLVEAAMSDDTHVEFGEWYAGYDVGLKNDLSALVLLRQTRDNRVWVQGIHVGKRVDWQLQKEAIFGAFRNHPIKKLCVDETGMGIGLVSELTARLGRSKVEGVVFSLQSKEVLATDMYQAFATGMIKIPRDQDLLRDILSIRRIITQSGKVTYDAPHTQDGHADRAWALALAIHACATKPGKRTMRGPGDFENV